MRLLLDANLSPRVVRMPEQADLLAANLPAVGEDLERGAIVSMTRLHMRVRELPIDRRA